ncbi:lipase 3-like [Schistocerca gregaria]|uniref:lipase 3-like n=1 Tax=Schistocerca gregaria TaxID=7010 RepID=UPI00211EB2F0|nr:lipase 3-like [Schistocerca gregaria]
MMAGGALPQALVLLLVVIAATTAAPAAGVPLAHNEDEDLDTAQLLRKYGYPVEEHFVTTADGYILRMFRVPSSPKASGGSAFPILVMHGLLASSADWVIMGPGKGFAYVLADAGFDVWMGNSRGNVYSRNHTTINPDDASFWQFSWHEMGDYDLPAMIDYVLAETGQSDIFYAGHSQGTTSFYVMASLHPEYNEKIRVMFSLAPVAYMNHMTSPLLQFISLFVDQLEFLAGLIGMNEFLPNSELMQLVGDIMCQDGAFTQDICSNVIFLLGGYNEAELNTTMLPVIMAHTPAGSSSKQLIHYGQEIRSGHFRQYDHGMIGNTLEYGSISPPDYDLSKVTAKVVLHYSNNDWCAGVKDVDRLYEELPNCIGRFLVAEDSFSHLDFMWAIHAKELVYDKVVSLMNQYL